MPNQQIDNVSSENLARKISLLVSVYIILITTGAIIIKYIERSQGWSYLDSFYFTTITILTIGYGDFTPYTDLGKLFVIFYALFGVTLSVYILFVVGRYLIISQFGSLRPGSKRKKN